MPNRNISTLVLAALALSLQAPAQVINTIAGSTFVFPTQPLPAVNAPLGGVTGVATDTAGNVYVADPDNHLVLKITSGGTLSVLAGNGSSGFTGDGGPALSASLTSPYGVAIDSAGSVYIADTGNHRIRKVSGGIITTIAGTGTAGFSGDGGVATGAMLDQPHGIAVDAAGNVYIGDTSNNRIRKISGGIITTIAGTGVGTFSGDNGPATSATLRNPYGVAVDAAGNLYIADTINNRIRKVSGGIIATVAGNGTFGPLGDGGPAISGSLLAPVDVALDSAGNLYICDTSNYLIQLVSNGIVTTLAGSGTFNFSGDGGPALAATFNNPTHVAVDSAGHVYVADTGNFRIRKISAGVISTFAGNGAFSFSGDGGPVLSAELDQPEAIAFDSAGALYVVQTADDRVRKVAAGTVTTIAGTGVYGFSGDGGSAASAQLASPSGVAADSAGNVYIADTNNQRIRKVSSGIITTVAGTGSGGFSGDGVPATSGTLFFPYGLAIDSAGNLYIADSDNNRIRKVSGGILTTVAGNGMQGFSGDGGPATSAMLSDPYDVKLDAAGNIYIADSGNNRIRKVSGGIITTIAGNGTLGYSGDGGPATSASLFSAQAIAVDSAGGVYIAEPNENFVRSVIGGIINTIVGNGTRGFSGDGGPAVNATLSSPGGVALDSSGNVYIADTLNGRIREITAPVITSINTAYGTSEIDQNFIEIHGTNLAGATAGPNTLTAALGGVSVTVNGKPALLYYVSSTQINALTPLDATTGPVQVVVTTNGLSATHSVNLFAVTPAFLHFDVAGDITAQHANYSDLGPTSLGAAFTPAKPGETIITYAVGFGLPSNALVSGSPTQSGQLPTLPVCQVSGSPATVAFAGLNGYAGLYQINLVIPANAANGENPVSCTYAGQTTATGTVVSVQR